jgi:leader peptidase (prepilin peptidase) / N-methyltransferase
MTDLVQWFGASIGKNVLFVIAALAGLICADPLARVIRRLPQKMVQQWRAQHRRAPSHKAYVGPPVSWQRHGAKRKILICVMTALLFSACVLRFSASWQALYAIGLVAALIVLTWIDFDHGVLPDAITLPFVWAGLLVNLNGVFVELPLAVAGAAGAYVFLCVVFYAFLWITDHEGMGRGDFKLLAALGAWFGWKAVPWLMLGACLSGLLAALWLRYRTHAQANQALPFGPHLALAGVVMLLSSYF